MGAFLMEFEQPRNLAAVEYWLPRNQNDGLAIGLAIQQLVFLGSFKISMSHPEYVSHHQILQLLGTHPRRQSAGKPCTVLT